MLSIDVLIFHSAILDEQLWCISIVKPTRCTSFPNLFCFLVTLYMFRGTRWRSWFRHCATSRKVADSIPDLHNRSGRNVALGLTQPLTEMSARNIYWGVKAAGAYG